MAGEQGRGPLLVLLFFISATVITVWGTWEGVLPPTEEAVRAETAREILVTGDWWTMHFDGAAVYDLPPLPMWTVAVFLKLFGTNELSAHLPFVLFSVLTFFLAFLAGEVRRGVVEPAQRWITQPRTLGLLSAIILAASPLFGRYAPDVDPCVPCAFFVMMAICGWLLLPKSRAGFFLWACGIAGGLLSGGGAALLVIPGSLLSLVTDRERRILWRSPAFLAATTLALVAGGSWLVPAALQGGGFSGNPLWAPFSTMGRSWGAAFLTFGESMRVLFVQNLPWSIPAAIAVGRTLFFRRSGGREPGEARQRGAGFNAIDDTLLAFLVVIAVPSAFGSAGDRSLLLPLIPPAALISAREIARWVAAASEKAADDPDAVVRRLWAFNQAVTAIFCLLMLLVLATPLRLHRTIDDPIEDVARMAGQITPAGSRLGNFGQPQRVQSARLLFYGDRSLGPRLDMPEQVLDAIDRERGAVFLASAGRLDALRKFVGDGTAYTFHILYRSSELVLFRAE